MSDNLNMEIFGVDSIRDAGHVYGEKIEADDERNCDFVGQMFKDAALAQALGGEQHVIGLQKESAVINRRAQQIYQQLAAAAAKAERVTDPHRLEKRFSPEPKAGYRQFFKDNLAKGKTATEILDGWCREFPTANPDCIKLMREVCAEF